MFSIAVLPEILWNIPSHKDAFGCTDTMNSPFPLFTRAMTCKHSHTQWFQTRGAAQADTIVYTAVSPPLGAGKHWDSDPPQVRSPSCWNHPRATGVPLASWGEYSTAAQNWTQRRRSHLKDKTVTSLSRSEKEPTSHRPVSALASVLLLVYKTLYSDGPRTDSIHQTCV